MSNAALPDHRQLVVIRSHQRIVNPVRPTPVLKPDFSGPQQLLQFSSGEHTGPKGFGPPPLCAQVKSSSNPTDVNILRGLQGVVQNFYAEQGLLICWAGFKSTVIQEARHSCEE